MTFVSIKHALLLSLVACATLVDHAQAACKTMNTRREVRDLNPDQLSQFVNAVKKLMSGNRPTPYDQFVQFHITNQKEAHGTPIFLPWHRKYLRELELALDAVSPGCVLPYWDWSADAQSPELSPILSADFFGSNGQEPSQCITDGPFASFKPYYKSDGYPECIARKYDQGGKIAPFASPEIIADIVGNSHSFDDFRTRIEGNPHGRVHNGIGSSFSTMASPNDPVFFMHHCHVDKIWYDWQQAHPDSANDAGANGASANIPPWNVPVSSMLNTQADNLCYSYANPIKAYAKSSDGKQRNQRRSVSPASGEAEGTSCSTVAPTDRGDLTRLRPAPELPSAWCEMNNLNVSQVRQHEEHGKQVCEKLNNLPGYVSPCALWNHEDFMLKLVKSGEVHEFTAYVDGKKMSVPVTPGANPMDAVYKAKNSFLGSGLLIKDTSTLLGELGNILGQDGVKGLTGVLGKVLQISPFGGFFGEGGGKDGEKKKLPGLFNPLGA